MTISEYPTITEEDGIPFLIYGVGKFEQQPNIRCAGGIGLQQILYTRSGCGQLTYNGSTYTLPPHTAACLNADVMCEYFPLEAETQTDWIQYSDQDIGPFLRKMQLCSLKIVPISQPLPVETAFDQILYLLRTRHPGCIYRSAPMLYQLLLEICAQETQACAHRPANDEKHMAQALEFIQTHYMEELTLPDIASRIGMSESYLCTLFKRKLGIRPIEFLSKKRIEEAKLLLSTTDLSIHQIGAAVGYPDKSYFGYVFRKQEHMSPSSFRQSAGHLSE